MFTHKIWSYLLWSPVISQLFILLFRCDGDCRQRVVTRILPKLPFLPPHPNSTSEMAESFAEVIVDDDALVKEVSRLHRVTHTSLGGASSWKSQSPSQ